MARNGGFWHSIRGQTPIAKREIRFGGWIPLGDSNLQPPRRDVAKSAAGVSGFAADEEVVSERAELVDCRVDPATQVGLDRAGLRG